MKIIFNQKEEYGIYTCSIETTLEDIHFGNKIVLGENKESGIPYTKSQIDKAVSEVLQDFIIRYTLELKRLNSKGLLL